MTYTIYDDTPLGSLLLAEENGSLTGVWMEGQKYGVDFSDKKAERDACSAVFTQTKAWLDSYFRGERPSAKELALAPVGREFRKAVWNILCEIPYGEVTTYGDIAKQMAVVCGVGKMSAQAVGGAVAHNPISIIIPCHRVVGSDGNLTGYAGGIEKKIKLLTLEGVDMDKLYMPKDLL